MKKVSNSYFQAILEATCGGLFPKYSDLWRYFHPSALLLDSDYFYFEIETSYQVEATYLITNNDQAGMFERRAHAMSDEQSRNMFH